MRLEGSLDAFSLPDIFSLLSMTKKTGGLHLRRDNVHGVVWLADGLITGGVSDLAHQSLGRRVAGNRQVADNLLNAAVEQVSRDAGVGFARALRDSRAVDEGDLHTLVCEHIVDTVFDLMRWSDGIFEFVVDEPNLDDVGVAREVDEVVTEVRGRLDIWSGIDARVAAPDSVLSLALDADGDPQLEAREWSLLALVDGRRTVADLVGMCGRGDYSVVVALAELVGRGLVRPEESEGVAALLRRQALIATLESLPAAPEPAAEPETAPSVDAARTPRRRAADRPTEVEVTDEDNTVTEITGGSRAARRDLASVTPQRPETLRPDRAPDHPEPLAAAVAVAGGGMAAASAAMPSGAIDRDPSVNKSLLLRLIAGVRGL